MSALSAFLSTWTATRATFGDGAPVDGAQLDGRAVRDGQELARSAAPRGDWSGDGSAAYGAVNEAQVSALGTFADIDRRFGAEIGRSAEVVGTGRRDLDAVRKWVVDAAATVPNNAAGQHLLWSIVGKGVGEVQNIVSRSAAEQSEIAGRVRALGDEYEMLGTDGTGGAMNDDPHYGRPR